MDDLLRANEEGAKQLRTHHEAMLREGAKSDAEKKRRFVMIQHIVERVNAVVEEFNARSTNGNIVTKGAGADWSYDLPNKAGSVTLRSDLDLDLKRIKGKYCGIIANLSSVYCYGTHFLLLEDEKSSDNNEWVAARVTNSALATQKKSPVEPFIVKLDDIARATSGIDVINVELTNDVDSAIREIFTLSFKEASKARAGRPKA